MNGFEDVQQTLVAFAFGVPRLLAMFILIPVFSRQIFKGMIHGGVVASLTLMTLPMVMTDAPAELPTVIYGVGIVFKEILIGLVIGFGAALPFWVIDSVGFFIDNQRGTTMASSIDPMTGAQTSPMGVLFTQALTVLFFVGGGILALLGAVYESYRVWPVFSFFPRIEGAALPYLLGMVDRMMALTVLLAAPVIIAMFITEFAMGLISRFTPQMNVFSLAMPIKSGLGVLILVIYIGVVLTVLGEQVLQVATHLSVLEMMWR